MRMTLSRPSRLASPAWSKGEFLEGTLLSPLKQPLLLSSCCVCSRCSPGCFPSLSAALQWPPGLPLVGRCQCGRRGTSPVCRGGILSHFIPAATEPVSLSEISILLLQSCFSQLFAPAAGKLHKVLVCARCLRLCGVLEGHFGPFAWIFWTL